MESCILLEFNQPNTSTSLLHILYCAKTCGNAPQKSNMVIYIIGGTYYHVGSEFTKKYELHSQTHRCLHDDIMSCKPCIMLTGYKRRQYVMCRPSTQGKQTSHWRTQNFKINLLLVSVNLVTCETYPTLRWPVHETTTTMNEGFYFDAEAKLCLCISLKSCPWRISISFFTTQLRFLPSPNRQKLLHK